MALIKRRLTFKGNQHYNLPSLHGLVTNEMRRKDDAMKTNAGIIKSKL
jgi:hypothetical protein